MKTRYAALLALFALLFFATKKAEAQAYTLVPYSSTYEPLVGSVILSSGFSWDDPWFAYEMPIDFYFFNQPVDSIYISEGYITFDDATTKYVSAYHADLVDAGYSEDQAYSPISWTIEEENGVNVLKIEWLYAGFYDEYDEVGYVDNVVSFQIWLYEGTDDVEIHYGPWECLTCEYPDINMEGFVAIADEEVNQVLAINGDPGIETVVPSWDAILTGFPVSGYTYWFQPNSTCTNGALDAGEDDVDCGGTCFACHCSNGVMDADEEGVDCGGLDCAPCAFEACDYDNTYYDDLTVPSVVGESEIFDIAWAGDMLTLVGLEAGNTYEITTCGNDAYDTQLSLYTEGGEEIIDFNDDYEECGLQSAIFYTSLDGDNVDLLLDEYNCQHNEVDMTITITLISGSSSGCGGVSPELCVVTYADIENKNLLVWEQVGGPVVHYNIYSELNSTDKFELIGQVPSNETSVFLDVKSKPTNRFHKYQISAVDSCGNESPRSEVHKTAFLQSNQGINGEVNLIWSHYQGVNFGSYVIWRVSDVNGEEALDTIPGTMNFYTDNAPPQGSQLYYQLELLGTLVCAATPKTTAANYNSSRSNTVQIIGLPVTTADISVKPEWNVFPNPVQQNAEAQVELPLGVGQVQIHIFDALGKVVSTNALDDPMGKPVALRTQDLKPGAYTVQVSSENIVDRKRILIR